MHPRKWIEQQHAPLPHSLMNPEVPNLDKILLKKLIFSELFRGFSHTLGSPLPCTTLAPVRRRLGG
jgi:hypothetical protein